MSEPQRRTLLAAATRILPSDDGPGAVETGVAAYIEKALTEEALQPVRPLLQQGLDLLSSLATELHGQAFADCSAEQQDDVLLHLETLDQPVPRTFLRRLVWLVLEGFLCDPARGGNRDGLGWVYIGYPAPDPPSSPNVP